ncbi:Exodeoxyribonuclease [compost metagenome]
MKILEPDVIALLVGDFNVMPTALGVYKPERWIADVLYRSEVRQANSDFIEQGWTDAIRHLHPDERIYTFWKYPPSARSSPANRASATSALVLNATASIFGWWESFA